MYDEKNYITANLEVEQMAKLRSLEEDFLHTTNKEIILIAYETKKK